MALGMLTAGTDDGSETQKELMELLIPGTNATPTVLNAEMATLADRMQTGTDWNVANSVWVKKDGNVKLTENYISDAVNYYRAELFAAPFDDSTVTDINNWVKENTRERIPKIVEYLDPQTSLVLMNAIAFDGEWNTPVSEYMVRKNANFTNADGSKSKVTMLQSDEHGYVQIAGGKGFLKAYEATGYFFLGLLPPEGVTAEEYLKKILAEKKTFSDAIREADFEPILQVEFPEFKAEYGAEMNDIMKALGVQKAFTGSAEFGKMITEDSERISVDRVVHKAMIEVDRKGTKAAAATEIKSTEAAAIDLNPEIIEIKLDRPFIYGIIDLQTGIPVFLGVQNTMK
ncbi:MAG: serpin family protein, partial [Eubacterium sp.]|nr:serpin family protein [Eubacterium sp.]